MFQHQFDSLLLGFRTLLSVGLLLALSGAAQAVIYLGVGSTYSQNFDAMGSSRTLPDSWQMTFNNSFTDPLRDPYLDSSSLVAFSASQGTPTTPGTYNYGRTGGFDRAIGSIPHNPNYPGWDSSSLRSSLLLLHLFIESSDVSALMISFDIETYYIDQLAITYWDGPQILGLYSSSGTPNQWNYVTAGVGSGSAAGHFFANPPNKSISTVLTSGSFSQGNLYLIFQFNGLSPSGIALDNVSITAVPETHLTVLGAISLVVILVDRRRGKFVK